VIVAVFLSLVVVVGVVLIIALAAIEAARPQHERFVAEALIERIKHETVASMLQAERQARGDRDVIKGRSWQRR